MRRLHICRGLHYGVAFGTSVDVCWFVCSFKLCRNIPLCRCFTALPSYVTVQCIIDHSNNTGSKGLTVVKTTKNTYVRNVRRNKQKQLNTFKNATLGIQYMRCLRNLQKQLRITYWVSTHSQVAIQRQRLVTMGSCVTDEKKRCLTIHTLSRKLGMMDNCNS